MPVTVAFLPLVATRYRAVLPAQLKERAREGLASPSRAQGDTANQGEELMGSDLASENNPGDHSDGDETNGGIPSPRPAPDDDIGNLPKIGSDDPVWWYDQPRKRGIDRRYWGQVERIGGAEGNQLRRYLAAAMWDLLDWANQQVKKSATDSESDSGEDGGADDTPA